MPSPSSNDPGTLPGFVVDPGFSIDPDKWAAELDDAWLRMKILCMALGLPSPELGQPLDLIYVQILEKLNEKIDILEGNNEYE